MKTNRILKQLKTIRPSPHPRPSGIPMRPGELSQAELRRVVIAIVG